MNIIIIERALLLKSVLKTTKYYGNKMVMNNNIENYNKSADF